jgi:hypothetical protein
MIYKPRSHTHKRKNHLNWSGTVEIIIGILAWLFVFVVFWWAVIKSIELYIR